MVLPRSQTIKFALITMYLDLLNQHATELIIPQVTSFEVSDFINLCLIRSHAGMADRLTHTWSDEVLIVQLCRVTVTNCVARNAVEI